MVAVKDSLQISSSNIEVVTYNVVSPYALTFCIVHILPTASYPTTIVIIKYLIISKFKHT